MPKQSLNSILNALLKGSDPLKGDVIEIKGTGRSNCTDNRRGRALHPSLLLRRNTDIDAGRDAERLTQQQSGAEIFLALAEVSDSQTVTFGTRCTPGSLPRRTLREIHYLTGRRAGGALVSVAGGLVALR